MPNSYNGFPVIPTTQPDKLQALAGITGKVRAGNIHTIFAWLLREYGKRVEKIDPKESWGYSYRKIRAGGSWSNHASGTAIDLNATKHPYKKAGTMTSKQRKECHAIMAESNQVLKWLEGFDEMHWEIRRGTTTAQINTLAKQINEKDDGPVRIKTQHFHKPNDDGQQLATEWTTLTFKIGDKKRANFYTENVAGVLETRLYLPINATITDTTLNRLQVRLVRKTDPIDPTGYDERIIAPDGKYSFHYIGPITPGAQYYWQARVTSGAGAVVAGPTRYVDWFQTT